MLGSNIVVWMKGRSFNCLKMSFSLLFLSTSWDSFINMQGVGVDNYAGAGTAGRSRLISEAALEEVLMLEHDDFERIILPINCPSSLILQKLDNTTSGEG